MAYGARLESVLGLRPRGFESPIFRQSKRRLIYWGAFCNVVMMRIRGGAMAESLRRSPPFFANKTTVFRAVFCLLGLFEVDSNVRG